MSSSDAFEEFILDTVKSLTLKAVLTLVVLGALFLALNSYLVSVRADRELPKSMREAERVEREERFREALERMEEHELGRP